MHHEHASLLTQKTQFWPLAAVEHELVVQADWELHYVVCCWGCVEGPAAPLLRYMDVSGPLLAALEDMPAQALPPYFRYLASLVHMVTRSATIVGFATLQS